MARIMNKQFPGYAYHNRIVNQCFQDYVYRDASYLVLKHLSHLARGTHLQIFSLTFLAILVKKDFSTSYYLVIHKACTNMHKYVRTSACSM